MLPSNVKYIFLSATIGNPGQFAMWITKLRKQPCNVVYTDYRPVPLEHFLCPAGGEGMYLVVDEKGKFRNDNFDKAILSLGEGGVSTIGMDKKKKNYDKLKTYKSKDGNKLNLNTQNISVSLILDKKIEKIVTIQINNQELLTQSKLNRL